MGLAVGHLIEELKGITRDCANVLVFLDEILQDVVEVGGTSTNSRTATARPSSFPAAFRCGATR
jgi:hypothetical protein